MCVLCLSQFNHFPGSFQLGRKDRLWRNLSRLLAQFGKKEFGFFPQTFVLPADMANLKSAWDEGNTKKKWIIKPVRSASAAAVVKLSRSDGVMDCALVMIRDNRKSPKSRKNYSTNHGKNTATNGS